MPAYSASATPSATTSAAASTIETFTSQAVITELRDHLSADETLYTRLEQSLQQAENVARGKINDALYEALDWPTSADAYCDYLEQFAQYVPKQTPAAPWKSPSGDGYQEVHDRMTHFYWLIDQPLDAADTVLQADAWFAEWLVRYTRAWGSFLDTPASLTDETLRSFREHAPKYQVGNSELPDGSSLTPSGWQTFNQFFARALPAGARAPEAPHDNTVIAFPADAALGGTYAIAADGSFPAITVKHSHAYADVATLLGADDQLAAAFHGGRFAHVHLKPYAYHRFHTPVAGKVVAVRHLEGRAYLKTGIKKGKLEGFNDATNGYEFHQQRGVLILDTANDPAGDIGLVALVPVGMGHVSSVRVTAAEGTRLAKGDEFGQFLYGGSDIALLFQAKANVTWSVEVKKEHLAGEVLGRALKR